MPTAVPMPKTTILKHPQAQGLGHLLDGLLARIARQRSFQASADHLGKAHLILRRHRLASRKRSSGIWTWVLIMMAICHDGDLE